MWHPHTSSTPVAYLWQQLYVVAALVAVNLCARHASAQVLVGNPFVSPNQNWVDAFPPPTRGGNWRLSLHTPSLIDTNNANPPTAGAVTNDGTYQPDVLIKDSFLAPATYDVNAILRTNDDDLIGVVWNYQDPNNYFRVGFRQQPGSGNFGGTEGVSVQKIVNGVVTQLVPSSPMAGTAAVDQAMIDNRTPFNVKVAVNGANYDVLFNGVSVASGTDPDLASGRKVGFQSWAQQADAAAVTPFWGSEFESISVTQGANTLFSESFAARQVPFRQIIMTNAAGVSTQTTASKEDLGNFGQAISDPWVFQHSNGFENATTSNIDFIGPAVVVDSAGSANFSNYEMRTRIGAADNDGIGVLVRVQDDNNFYRINFTNEATGAGATRAPRGMSVQKVRNGVWSELYRDDNNPLFVYTPAAAGTTPATAGFPAFDLTVGAVGNSLKIQVRDQNGNVITYPRIIDAADPILTGTVGFATWGTTDVYYTGHGGQSGPLLTTLNQFTDVDVTVNRGTGSITLKNNGVSPVSIKGISISSLAGSLNPATWTPITDHFDEPPPGNGSVDPDDPWTIVASTATNLSEAEQSGGNGATLAVGQTVTLGNAWIKSRIEDVGVELTLGNGNLSAAAVAFSGTPFARSDLNTDGLVNANDWPLFVPNLLADLSALTGVGRALAGDLDGDGDNDVYDFALFKTDFDVANGAGAFQAMLAGLPEPSTFAMLAIAATGMLLARNGRSARRLMIVAVSLVAIQSVVVSTWAVPVDLTTYISESFPPADGFPTAAWGVAATSATLNNNADASVLYSPDSALNKRFFGRLTPGTDDDVVGFVLGFEPGDAQLSSAADYLLIDWKGADQNFDFIDLVGSGNFHHDQTPTGLMPVGLALSRVTGTPTADELWQHADLPENPSGGVTQLARGATLGSTAYNRSNGSHQFEIRYSSTNVTVLVDGVQQFNLDGTYPDGRFGLYSAWQGPQPTFSDFEVFDANFGLSATVDRSTGNITLRNGSNTPFSFDYYQLDSESGSLNEGGWNSLSDQNFQTVGAGPGQSWDEAGGSGPTALAEAFLQGSSMLAGNATVNIGNAYNNTLNGEDLALSFRLTSGQVLTGTVQYIGTPPASLTGDYNGNGTVDAADYVLWRNGGPLANEGATPGVASPEDYDVWRTNFGKPSPGSAAALAGNTSVPEPSAACLATLLFATAAFCRARRNACSLPVI